MSNIINCIKENVYNSKVIVINNILGLIVNDKKLKMEFIEKLKMEFIKKLDNILGLIVNDGVYREIR